MNGRHCLETQERVSNVNREEIKKLRALILVSYVGGGHGIHGGWVFENFKIVGWQKR